MRNEILSEIFYYIKNVESACIIGASDNKTQFLNYVQRKDVLMSYLQEKVMIICVDFSQLVKVDEKNFYELLLSSLLHETSLYNLDQSIFIRIDQKEIESALMIRTLEYMIGVLVTNYEYNICFFLDEFDECYQKIHPNVLSQLRALRDEFKYHLCYFPVFNRPPNGIRDLRECESFYELISRNLIKI